MTKISKYLLYKLNILYIIVLISNVLYSQISNHMDLVSQVKIPEHASSIWGYTDSSGIEYAILGTEQGVRIYSLEVPSSPLELKFIQCTPSAWRELKTAKEYAYVVTEGGDGLLIIDLRNPMDSIPYQFVKTFKNLNGDTFFVHSAHTLYVDEKNYIYLSGARTIGGGFIILDPNQDPFNPVIINSNEDQYMHEVHAYHDTLYGAELFNGVFSIWDLKDRTKPVRISDQITSKTFTHSVWIEKNRPILYTADEVEAAVIEAWDISDPLNIKKTDEYKVKDGKSPFIIPHNVFHYNDKLYVSYYTEGVRILDTKDPYNLIEVAYYDTQENFESGFHGCWSVYPFFDSGICIASDIENGLFVLRYDGNKPAYVEALIVDKADGSPVSNAALKIEQKNRSVEAFSNLKGIVKTGFPEEDSVNIEITKKGYYTQTLHIKLDKGIPLILKIELIELPKHSIQILVKDQLSNEIIQDAKIALYNTDFKYSISTDQNGFAQIQDVYENQWSLVVGKWAYQQEALLDFKLNQNQIIEIALSKAYEDDFILDLGWTTQSQDPMVKWKIGDFTEFPFPFSNFPSKDIDSDFGTSCYYTDNYNESDINYRIHGTVSLISPRMDLSGFESIDLKYHAWAYGGFIATKEIILQTQDTSILLESVSENLSGLFNPESNIHLELNNLKRDSVNFIFKLYNDSASADMAIRLMGAIDVFRLTGKEIVGTVTSKSKSAFQIYPNPVSSKLHLKYNEEYINKTVSVYSLTGQCIQKLEINSAGNMQIDISHYNGGIYLIRIDGDPLIYQFVKM
ncbi:MAG: choice-of-anchor B family protein [Saprospiraceae bacterium]|nr:choice-of-anchor B family protein [Saprospiraceae bacterium]